MAVDEPKATLFLLSYNQAAYLPEAIRGAFSQDFDGLEIIISDDCSSDGSQEIIRKAASSYLGPHALVTNFNPVNLGIVPHVNLGFKLARAPVVVMAASDDISLPHRVRRIIETMSERGAERTLAVVSDAILINDAGNEQGYASNCRNERDLTAFALARDGGYINGAAAAYARSLIVEMGDLEPKACAEDSILPFRAALLGRVGHIPEALLLRRIHDQSMTGAAGKDQRALLRAIEPMQHAFAVRLIDLQHPHVTEKFDEQTLEQFRLLVVQSIQRIQLGVALLKRSRGALFDLLKSIVDRRVDIGMALKILFMFRFPHVWKTYLNIGSIVRRFATRMLDKSLS
ncbi:MAG: glycosyltransferase [Reyranellaceae bacterium]